MTFTLAYMLKSSSQQTLGALKGILAKGEAHARALKVEDSVMLAQRLSPDMFALPRQVQIACDTVARGAARLAGREMPSFPDTEQSFEELSARCQAALDFIESLPDAEIDANTDTVLQIPFGPTTMPMEGRTYLQGFVLTNLHFHASMAYALLRMQGVPLGKKDFLVPA